MQLATNILGFQIAWFACVTGAGHGRPWIGPAVTLVVLTVHLALHSKTFWPEVTLIVVSSTIGFVADSSLVLAGLLDFPEPARLGSPSTAWMVALWANFAATLNVSLRWLGDRSFTAGLLGGVGGPLAYYAGAQLGALTLGARPVVSLVMVGAVWAVFTPLLSGWARRLRSGEVYHPVEVRS